MTEIDWSALRDRALGETKHSYVPYSHFPVGAAGLVDDGRIVSGCNVENASYGLSLCAECGLISNLAASGGGRLVAVVAMHGDGEILMPCGRCRQLLYEFGGRDVLVDSKTGPKPLGELLPDSFGAEDLAQREH